MQKEFIGEGSFRKIQEIVNFTKAKKVFIVTGKKSFILSGAQKIINELLRDRKVVIFNDFNPNPELQDVAKGVDLLRRNHSDLIVAIGGGSSLDMAKLVNISAAHSKFDFFDIIKNPDLISNRGLPLVAVPTTAGSGSQATHFAVIYVNKKKYSLAHDYILPDYAIVDSTLCYNVSKKNAASSAMDALSQSIESYWSLNATHESQHYASVAIKLILNSIDLAINQKNRDSIQSVSLASHLSGKAINITKTTAPHAISYILTSDFNVPHGHAVASLLAPVAYVSVDNGDSRYKDALNEIFDLFECKSIDEFCTIWKQLMNKCGLHSKLECFGITLNDLNFIVDNVNVERLKGHPAPLNRLDIEKIVKIAIFGY